MEEKEEAAATLKAQLDKIGTKPYLSVLRRRLLTRLHSLSVEASSPLSPSSPPIFSTPPPQEQDQILANLEALVDGRVAAAASAVSFVSSSVLPTNVQKCDPVCVTPSCRENVLKHDTVHSTLVCNKCGRTQPFIDAVSTAAAYGDEVEISNVTYKKIVHLRDHLMLAQDKEPTKVPDEIVKQICEFMRDKKGFLGLHSASVITLEDVQRSMKEMRSKAIRKYYKNKVQIWAQITGIPAPRLSPEQEQAIIHDFKQLQPFFEQGSLPYRYCIHRLFEYHQLPAFQKMFPLPKNATKLEQHDTKLESAIQQLRWDRRRFVLSSDLRATRLTGHKRRSRGSAATKTTTKKVEVK